MLLGFYLLLAVLHVTEGCSIINNTKTTNVTKNVGDAVLLPCSCSNLQDTPQDLKWRKHNLKNEWDLISTNQSRYQLSNVQSPGNVSLLISHLSLQDDGLYRCETRPGKYTDFNLSVKGGNHTEMPDQTSETFLAFIPVVLLLLGLGGIIFWRYRAKKREQTQSSKESTGQKDEEETQRNEQKAQDDVMYTTVVHSDTSQRPKAIRTEERTEYAIIKLN